MAAMSGAKSEHAPDTEARPWFCALKGCGGGRASCCAPASGQPRCRADSLDVPAGPLGQVLARIGAMGHATILVTDPVLGTLPSRGVHDAHSLHDALRQAMRGIEARAHFIDPHTIRVSATPRRSQPPTAPPRRRRPTSSSPPASRLWASTAIPVR
jgi:hypothetical protein